MEIFNNNSSTDVNSSSCSVSSASVIGNVNEIFEKVQNDKYRRDSQSVCNTLDYCLKAAAQDAKHMYQQNIKSKKRKNTFPQETLRNKKNKSCK